MIKTKQVLECDGHCGATADLADFHSAEAWRPVPDDWSTIWLTMQTESMQAGRKMHWCPRCTAIAGYAIWTPKVRAFVVAAGLSLPSGSDPT